MCSQKKQVWLVFKSGLVESERVATEYDGRTLTFSTGIGGAEAFKKVFNITHNLDTDVF